MARGVIWDTHNPPTPTHTHTHTLAYNTRTHKQMWTLIHTRTFRLASFSLLAFLSFFLRLPLSHTRAHTHTHTDTHIHTTHTDTHIHTTHLWPGSRSKVRVQLGNGVSPTWRCQVIHRGGVVWLHVLRECVRVCLRGVAEMGPGWMTQIVAATLKSSGGVRWKIKSRS